MAKRHIFYFALSENAEAAGRVLDALQSGLVDNVVVIHPGADLPDPFASCGAPSHKLQDLICQRNASWMGDAMRNVCHELARLSGPNDMIMLMSSDAAPGTQCCSRAAGWDAIDCDLVYNNFADNTFSRTPPKIGGFEGLILKASVLRDSLFIKFWANLAPGMKPGADRLFAQYHFHKTFSAKYGVNAFAPDAVVKTAIASVFSLKTPPVGTAVPVKQMRAKPPAKAGPSHVHKPWRPEQHAAAEEA